MSKAGKQILDGLKDAVEGNFARVHIPDGTGKLQTWARVDAGSDCTAIHRSQHDALIGAAMAARKFMGRISRDVAMKERDELECALRSAGIEGEKP